MAAAGSQTEAGTAGSAASTGTRSTRQKRAVEAALDAADSFLTAQQLHAWLREQGDAVGLATVYRVLQAAAALGDVDAVTNPNGEVAYRRCSTRHHHHLMCRSCGRAIEVEGPAVEKWASAVAADHGFVEVTHTVELLGTCEACAKDAKRA